MVVKMTKMTKKYRFCHFYSNVEWGRENGTNKKRLIRPPDTDSEAGHFFVSYLVLPRFISRDGAYKCRGNMVD